MSKPMMRMIGAGGCGISIVSRLAMPESPEGFANIQQCYVSTSKADLAGRNLPAESVYSIADLDGQGSVRGLNIDDIRPHIPQVLFKHAPGDINIIVHSTSGGSGSVIGPLLAQAMLERGEQVIVVAVASFISAVQLTNTINTVRSYANIVEESQRPLAVSWHNNQEKTAKDVDASVHFVLSLLAVLYSGDNTNLDSADLKNWLNYGRATGYAPELCMLDIPSVVNGALADTASAAVLLAPGQEPPVGLQVPYVTHGQMREETAAMIRRNGRVGPVVLGLRMGGFDQEMKRLVQEQAKNNERVAVRPVSKLGTGGKGLVF